jgi:hypothetical protein
MRIRTDGEATPAALAPAASVDDLVQAPNRAVPKL